MPQFFSLPLSGPQRSLQAGQWVKLICGASYQDMPTIRRLVMLYALAGVDCVDVAADPAVVAAAREGLGDAVRLAPYLGDRQHLLPDLPWLMVSLNDNEDPHFRKAFFEAAHCPPTCDRPCETLCPTAAIQFTGVGQGGVRPNLCYGCGRCLTVCPINHIVAQPHQVRPEDFPSDRLGQIDAVEIHTQTGRQQDFAHLWRRLAPWRHQLKLISISCPDDDGVVAYLKDLYAIMAPLTIPLIWQTDGRPMSGDLGKGTTHATLRLAQKILAAELPGYVQLAGGTNHYTVKKLRDLRLLRSTAPDQNPPPTAAAQMLCNQPSVSGVAYGSYARTLVMPALAAMEQERIAGGSPMALLDQPAQPTKPFDKMALISPCSKVESSLMVKDSSALVIGLHQARQLVGQIKAGVI